MVPCSGRLVADWGMSSATVSVVATATVAIASMLLQAGLDRSRRRHERELSLQALRVDATNEFLGAVERRHRLISRSSVTRGRPLEERSDEDLLAASNEHRATLGDITAAVRRLRLLMPRTIRDEADELLDLSEGLRAVYGQGIDIDDLVAHDGAMSEALRTFEEHVASVIQDVGS